MLICINDSIMLKSDADINRDKIHRVIRNLHWFYLHCFGIWNISLFELLKQKI